MVSALSNKGGVGLELRALAPVPALLPTQHDLEKRPSGQDGLQWSWSAEG